MRSTSIIMITIVLLLAPFSARAEDLRIMVLHTVTRCTELTASEFYKATGNKVIVEPLSTEDYLNILDSGAYKKYDVFEIWYVMLEDYVRHNILLDISNVLSDDELRDFVPQVLNNYGYVSDKIYAIPYDGDCHYLYYRPSILAKYKLSPPQTWEEYTRAVKLISEKESAHGLWGTVLMANNNPFNITTMFYNRLGYDDENNDVSEAKIRRALRALKETLQFAHPDSLKTNYKMSRSLFLDGKVALLEQYNDISVRADDVAQSVIKGDWDAVIIPRWSSDNKRIASMNGGFGLGVNSASKKRSLAVNFVKFASTPDMQKMRTMNNCGVEPTRKSILSDPEYYSFSVNSSLFAATYQRSRPWKKEIKSIMEATTILHGYASGIISEDDATTALTRLLGSI